jgi:hypothetical protein
MCALASKGKGEKNKREAYVRANAPRSEALALATENGIND